MRPPATQRGHRDLSRGLQRGMMSCAKEPGEIEGFENPEEQPSVVYRRRMASQRVMLSSVIKDAAT